jgi:YHS domain-containing protein
MALIIAGWATGGDKQKDDDVVLQRLQEVQDVVGTWTGSGKGARSEGWNERVECRWQFDRKKGTTAIVFTFRPDAKATDAPLLEQATLTFDPAKSTYVLTVRQGRDDGGAPLIFEGKPKSKTNLIFERVEKGQAKDALDRLDLKILNDGDRLVYSFHRRLGASRKFRPYAQVGLNREGASLAAHEPTGPKCIVTGGAGTMTVTYNGQSYFVCCSGCREVFLEDPEKFLAKVK